MDHDTIAGRVRPVERFIEHTNEFPWMWTPAMVEEFFANPEHVLDGLGLRMQYGNRPDHIHGTALIDGQNGLQTGLIQCIIESFSESLPHRCR